MNAARVNAAPAGRPGRTKRPLLLSSLALILAVVAVLPLWFALAVLAIPGAAGPLGGAFLFVVYFGWVLIPVAALAALALAVVCLVRRLPGFRRSLAALLLSVFALLGCGLLLANLAANPPA